VSIPGVVKVVPTLPNQHLDAIRWAEDGSNWRDVLAFMRLPLDEDSGAPGCLVDTQGVEFGPGSWVVRVSKYVSVSMNVAEFADQFKVAEASK